MVLYAAFQALVVAGVVILALVYAARRYVPSLRRQAPPVAGTAPAAACPQCNGCGSCGTSGSLAAPSPARAGRAQPLRFVPRAAPLSDRDAA